MPRVMGATAALLPPPLCEAASGLAVFAAAGGGDDRVPDATRRLRQRKRPR